MLICLLVKLGSNDRHLIIVFRFSFSSYQKTQCINRENRITIKDHEREYETSAKKKGPSSKCVLKDRLIFKTFVGWPV